MSLILEALNKAENDRNGDIAQSTYRKYSISDNNNKWLKPSPILLLTIGLAGIGLYLSASFVAKQPELPPTNLNNDKAGSQTEQHLAKQPQTAVAPASVKSAAPTLPKKESTRTLHSSNKAQQTKQQPPGPTAHAKGTPSESPLEAPSIAHQTPERRPLKHKQQTMQLHDIYTPATNPPPSHPANTNDEHTTDPHPAADEYLSAPIFQNLPTSTKSQLPDLELNIHVYSTDPGKSFVFINSKRYREGAKIGNDIILEKIIPTGVVLRHQNTLFRLVIKT